MSSKTKKLSALILETAEKTDLWIPLYNNIDELDDGFGTEGKTQGILQDFIDDKNVDKLDKKGIRVELSDGFEYALFEQQRIFKPSFYELSFRRPEETDEELSYERLQHIFTGQFEGILSAVQEGVTNAVSLMQFYNQRAAREDQLREAADKLELEISDDLIYEFLDLDEPADFDFKPKVIRHRNPALQLISAAA